MWIVDFFRKLFSVGEARKEESSKLIPQRLIEAVIEKADSGEMSWLNPDLPNVYDVYISRMEWDRYYGGRARYSEERLEQALREYADEIGASMADPKVSLMVDPLISGAHVDVSARFSTTNGAKTPVVASAVGANQVSPAERIMRGGSETSFVAVGQAPTKLLHTDLSVPPKLVMTSGFAYSVFDKATMGFVHDDSRDDYPDIVLPKGDSMAYCSQVQGQFSEEGGSWRYANLGKNKVGIVRGGILYESSSMPFMLEDGDLLTFGAGMAPFATFMMAH